MKRLLLIAALAAAGVQAFAQVDTIYLSNLNTTHIRFSSEIKYVDISSKVIAARIVDGSKDILALKAREPFDYMTTVSCLEGNGVMHTFVVAFAEKPSELIIDTRKKAEAVVVTPAVAGVSGAAGSGSGRSAGSGSAASGRAAAVKKEDPAMKKKIYHIGASAYDISVYCDNIFIKDDITHIVFSIHNNSSVSYVTSEPRFAIESKKRTKRGLAYEKQLFPRSASGLGSTAPGTISRLEFTFDKVTLIHGQVFRLYLYEQGGARHYVLTFGVKDIGRAERK